MILRPSARRGSSGEHRARTGSHHHDLRGFPSVPLQLIRGARLSGACHHKQSVNNAPQSHKQRWIACELQLTCCQGECARRHRVRTPGQYVCHPNPSMYPCFWEPFMASTVPCQCCPEFIPTGVAISDAGVARGAPNASGLPPECPHGEYSGARPGARHGCLRRDL